MCEKIPLYIDYPSSFWQIDYIFRMGILHSEIDILYSENFDNFLSKPGKKIACFNAYLHDLHEYKFDGWYDKFKQLDEDTQVFIFCPELHKDLVNDMKVVDRPNVTIFISGMLNVNNLKHAKVHSWLDWLIMTSGNYRLFPQVLNRLTPYTAKPKSFDILLGMQRFHRDYVYNFVNNNSTLLEQSIMTYYRTEVPNLIGSGSFIFDDTNTLECENATLSVSQVKYHGYTTTLSQIIPVSVYNAANYSIITETNFSDDYNFLTEKTAKPLIAKRLFIMIAGKHFLKNLRALGFETFDSVIDESYDNISNNYDRWRSALTQAEYLCTQDPIKIYSKIKAILEHNSALALSEDWIFNTAFHIKSTVKNIKYGSRN